MPDLSKLPVTVITGFLGAGKDHVDSPPDAEPPRQTSGRGCQ